MIILIAILFKQDIDVANLRFISSGDHEELNGISLLLDKRMFLITPMKQLQ